ncbi:MAG: hypothetical protein ABI895_27460 [Deltaproteobacteria bacterium]
MDGRLGKTFIRSRPSRAQRLRSTQGEPLLTFVNPQAFAVTPKILGQPNKDDPRTAIKGWLQGAVMDAGKGHLAVFGEAAMFSAQLAGPAQMPMGMNHPLAKQNAQFVLNVMHWLSGILHQSKARTSAH